MQALGKNETWDLVHHSPYEKAISCKWIYKVKYNGEHIADINNIKMLLSNKFEMKDMEELHYFLGI